MARGWESKSIESQQQDKAKSESVPARPALSPVQQQRQRDIGGLRLSRQRVLDELTRVSDSRHEAMLRTALADLDAKLKALE